MAVKQSEKKLNTLIIEDEPVASAIVKIALEGQSDYSVAESGDTALKMFSSSLSSKKYFNVVLIDIGLPDMNGKDILKKIDELEAKENVPQDKRVKKIMVTASSGKDDLFGSIRDQCDDYLLKPVTKEILLDKLRAVGVL